jgi:ABC-2 type transport system permease protein
MLWYKGWLETRIRLLFVFAFYAACFAVIAVVKPPQSSPFAAMNAPDQVRTIIRFGFATYAVVMASLTLAGAGITTQSSFQQTKGLHGSTLFTLSLPVSRFRLLVVRAGLGWLETAGFLGALCGAMWIAFLPLRANFRPEEMAGYAATLIGCSLGIYSIPMLLATFLDDVWRMFGSVPVFVALWWLFNHTPLPASVNIFRAMGEGSPLVAHTMPWMAMAFSLGFAAILFFAALKIVQRREY